LGNSVKGKRREMDQQSSVYSLLDLLGNYRLRCHFFKRGNDYRRRTFNRRTYGLHGSHNRGEGNGENRKLQPKEKKCPMKTDRFKSLNGPLPLGDKLADNHPAHCLFTNKNAIYQSLAAGL
jgi:hypothetical protein